MTQNALKHWLEPLVKTTSHKCKNTRHNQGTQPLCYLPQLLSAHAVLSAGRLSGGRICFRPLTQVKCTEPYERGALSDDGGCYSLNKTPIAPGCRNCIFSGRRQQSQVAPNPQASPTGLKEEAPSALHCPYYWRWTTFAELLKVSAGTAISSFGNFIVRQPAFWVCCYHGSQLMFLTLFLASSVLQASALGRKHEKPGAAACAFSSCLLGFTTIEVGKLYF